VPRPVVGWALEGSQLRQCAIIAALQEMGETLATMAGDDINHPDRRQENVSRI
jgi:hypothetical protein